MDSSEMGKKGGRARAKALSAEKRREIAVKASHEAKKIRGTKQKRVYELLTVLYDHLAAGWKISHHTQIGKGPETVLQRVAALMRDFANKKEIPSPNSRFVCEMLTDKVSPKAKKTTD